MKRGHLVYSIMFSCFGVSTMTGSIIVKYFQDHIGYSGLFLISFFLTMVAAIITCKFGNIKFNYLQKLRPQQIKEFEMSRGLILL
mmetsp:Transcript_21400/g.20578  ORF Transcript_21400/g.20578 Transcript_21400/m.20578 type:complete len:85 (+) Transcript_21400:525-779(+)